jgi:hypothetical protein
VLPTSRNVGAEKRRKVPILGKTRDFRPFDSSVPSLRPTFPVGWCYLDRKNNTSRKFGHKLASNTAVSASSSRSVITPTRKKKKKAAIKNQPETSHRCEKAPPRPPRPKLNAYEKYIITPPRSTRNPISRNELRIQEDNLQRREVFRARNAIARAAAKLANRKCMDTNKVYAAVNNDVIDMRYHLSCYLELMNVTNRDRLCRAELQLLKELLTVEMKTIPLHELKLKPGKRILTPEQRKALETS